MEAFICPSCDEPISRDDSFACSDCDAHWCIPCGNSGRADSFIYNGEYKCTFCFPTSPVRIRTADLLEYALEELGMTKKALKNNVRDFGHKRFRVAPNVFECTFHTECASTRCKHVAINQDIEDDEKGWKADTKGYCCEAVHDATGKPLSLCIDCQRWEARPLVIALIGMRRFRKSSLWAQLSRDVLITCIIKPFCWPK